jgi:uncharacterized DUF497 family protein
VSPEFDPKKNEANIAKHGVSLSEADGMLLDPLALTVEDDSADGEVRYVTVGLNTMGTVMVVAWAERDDEVRLSARKAEPKERRAYEEGI